jgi:probable F420-dependent oxidoreductase
MKFGLFLPQREIGHDFQNVLDFVRVTESAGFDFLQATDHVLGADTATRPPLGRCLRPARPVPRAARALWLLSCAVTDLELVTAVLILPQRQTALVAKQAAQIDIVTGGRFRLGVGVGWNAVEYEALGIDFLTRGARCEEQIEVLRRLWTQESVDFEGRFHRIDRAGILPRPIQRPIPIWIGGGQTTRVLSRIGRLSDGWLAGGPPGETNDRAWAFICQAAREAGREELPGLQLGLRIQGHDLGEFERQVEACERSGATHVSIRCDNPIDPRDPIRSLDHYVEIVSSAAQVLAERLESPKKVSSSAH